MSSHKYINRICCIISAITLLLSVLFINAEKLGIYAANNTGILGYEKKLFDTSKVHTINIVMDDWDDFISTCTNEEYKACSVIIDNESFKNVAIRAKGNTSLQQVANYNNDRYSFKIEFDHYNTSSTYYGLDKLSLNNIIQDNTYMKDYLCYRMMDAAGAKAPLCSYVQISVNGEEWGLYLAIESIEESFLSRNYGNNYGNLYKPDSMDMNAGGQANKIDTNDKKGQNTTPPNTDNENNPDNAKMPQMIKNGSDNNMPGGNMGMGTKGSSDVSLIYTDDEIDSYSNIFENAKTDIKKSDKKRLISSLKQLGENENIENVVDVDSVIRYFVAHNFVCNFDSYTGSMIHNYYLYEDNGKLSMLPWDYNLAFGGFGGGNAQSIVNYPIDTPVSGGTLDSRPMIAWIFNSEKYTKMYHQYFSDLIKNYFTSGVFTKEIQTVKSLIAPYVKSDPTKFCTYDEFETGAETLEKFCELRVQSVEKQLNGEISSTSDEQSKDNSAFIETANLNISDMGSMAGGPGENPQNNQNGMPPQNDNQNGMSPPNNGQNGTPPDMPQMNKDDSSSLNNADDSKESSKEENSKKESSEINKEESSETNDKNDSNVNDMPQKFQNPPEGQNGSRPNNGSPENENQNEDISKTLILTGISIVVLLGGLLFAWVYKRK